MRNLVEYPITTAEIARCLDEMANVTNNLGLIGDMRPILLSVAAYLIQTRAPNMEITIDDLIAWRIK